MLFRSPDSLQQYYYFQKSLISLASGDRTGAMGMLEQAINDDADQGWDGQQVFYLTLSSALQFDAGNAELAMQRLGRAERAVRRARLNGVDDASINYTESSIHAMRGRSDEALASLQSAYDRGFRGIWMLDMDLRMDSVRDEPQFLAIRQDRKSTRLNSSHSQQSRMPSSA